MGILDDAIREHLELRRRAGADAAEIARLERTAFGDEAPPPAPAAEDQPVAAEPAQAEAQAPVPAPEPPAAVEPEPAPQPVGLLQADDPHAVVTDLLGHLGRDRDRLALELDVHLERVVDLGERVGRELHVDDGAGDGDDAPRLQLSVLGRGLGVGSGSHGCS